MLPLTNKKSRDDIKKRLNLKNDQFKIIECICHEGLVVSRLQNRKNDYSDADLSIYKRIKEIYEPIKEKHITVDTSQPLKEIVSEVANRLQDYEP